METTTKPDGTKVETTTAKDGSTSKTTTNPNGSSVTENKAADGSTGTVKIVDNSKDFIDTRNHWAKDEINFVASRELFKGVTEEHFGVERTMTRAMVNTVLARLAGVDTTPAAGQNWCDKGICVSELRYITVEAALAGRATITLNCDSPVTRQKVTRRYKETPSRTEQAFWSDAVRFFHRVECQSAQALTMQRHSQHLRIEHRQEHSASRLILWTDLHFSRALV